MDDIRRAVERAKTYASQRSNSSQSESQAGRQGTRVFIQSSTAKQTNKGIELNIGHLQSHRIVAYDGQDPRSRSFDVLRTEVLRSMDLNSWKTLAVTSPTPSCGKTLTAVNLALSMARQPERKVRLVDLDLRNPRVASTLGLSCRDGALGVLEGRIDIEASTIDAGAGGSRLEILPTAASTNASDLVASTGMNIFLQHLVAHERSRIVILDLPPLLTGHDVISILPQVDCVLLVAAVGVSRLSEIEECYKYLRATDVVRFVLNKVPHSPTTYAYY